MKQRPRAGARAVGAMGCSCRASQSLTVAPGTGTSQEAPPCPRRNVAIFHPGDGLARGLGTGGRGSQEDWAICSWEDMAS